MVGPTIDLEKRNFIGGLDNLVVNIGMAAIAVFPTLGAIIATPWKMLPVLTEERPDGRDGLLLRPGVFFILSLTIVLLMVSSVTTPAIVRSNSGAIGPGLALEVAAAAREGQIWRTVSNIAPIYVFAVAIGALGALLARWAGAWWSLRTSVSAALFVVATIVCWIVISSALIDTLRVSSGNDALGMRLYNLNVIPMMLIWHWAYFWLFKTGGKLSTARAIVLTAAMTLLVFLIGAVVQILP